MALLSSGKLCGCLVSLYRYMNCLVQTYGKAYQRFYEFFFELIMLICSITSLLLQHNLKMMHHVLEKYDSQIE